MLKAIGRLRDGLLAALVLSACAAHAATITYTYDPLGRLSSVQYGNGAPATYSYDAAGNRTQVVLGAAPIANPVSATVAFNSTNNPITLSTSGVVAAVAVSTAPSHGAATASGTSIHYSPTTGYSGPDSFGYTASNGAGTSPPATVTVTVNVQTPVANPVSATVAYNSTNDPIALSISGGAASSVAVSTPAAHGTATASGTAISYTPTSGYSGADSFQYTASNAGGTSAPAAAAITVNPAAPIANPGSYTVAFNSSNNPLALNITGGAAASVAITVGPGHGAASVNGVSSITYTPTVNYSGADAITYSATNAAGSSAATLSITVSPPAAMSASIAGGALASGPSSGHSFPTNTVTVTGGSGSFTYLWSNTNDGFGTWNTGGTTTTFTPIVSGVTLSTGCVSVAHYSVTVTDTVTHLTTTSNLANYRWTSTGGTCGA